ncbi:hypothetical protein ASF56_25045 [Methylobacterium sp. Leaf122]|nr:hypothetical protein ASF33_18985 [Methylobacterium sp. Leaf92]KQQ06658.1 hypothetical protein ASF59_01975 [Methylobacterium sp. Leaf121]KQQ07780.1 hypothetical protein ASF56_25045 [Methylobacterium sp. Leaf122]
MLSRGYARAAVVPPSGSGGRGGGPVCRDARLINKPDGERSVQTDDKPAACGKLGRDKYIASVPTPPFTPFGNATIYSYTVRMCNLWEWMFPVQYAEPWLDEFEFGPETRRISPEQAKNSPAR